MSTPLLPVALSVFFLATLGCGCNSNKEDADGWRSETVDDDHWARWRFSETDNAAGETVQFIEDETVSVAQGNLDDVVALFLDVPGYVETFQNEETFVIETLSENQWLIYESINNPWPVKDSDRVCELTLVREEGSVSFHFSATPEAYPLQDLARQEYYEVTYTFLERDDGWLEIREVGEAIPPVKVPNWILKSAFPKVLFENLENIGALLED